MASYNESVCRLCRREGLKLFLKGERCMTEKCAYTRRTYAPGEHGQTAKRKNTEYFLQLREKQKLKRIYGLLEKQFRNYFEKAERQKGLTGENLLKIIECRLDNVIYSMGFAVSRKQGRQLVGHGHFLINKKIIDIPSYIIKVGDQIEIKPASKEGDLFKNIIKSTKDREISSWLTVDKDNFNGSVKALPVRDDIKIPVHEQLIVELYSK